MLGWFNLKAEEHVVAVDVRGAHKGQRVRWYYCGSYDDIVLHVNENPIWHAAVYAVRYRIHTGWHRFYPYRSTVRLRKEAKRLKEFLYADWFFTIEQRRAFRLRHPECTGYTWRRLRLEGPPYDCTRV